VVNIGGWGRAVIPREIAVEANSVQNASIGRRTMVDPIPFLVAVSGVLLLGWLWERFKRS
jgi:hypothetical protein